MGNQREIIQTSPVRRRGVVLTVRPGVTSLAHLLVERVRGTFYSFFIPAGEPDMLPHMDGDTETLPATDVARIAIQSGGKMWCGYESFVDHARLISSLVEDATFYVGDDEDYIDEFRIQSGQLNYQRVHQGYWRPIDDYLSTIRVLEKDC